jgi:hypothetical protein
MNASVSARGKSKKLPARTAQGIQVRMLWPSAVVDEIDQWAAAQPDKPDRSEAILRLVQQALAGAISKQPESPRSLTEVLRAASAVHTTPARPLAALPPPKRDAERIDVEARQPSREVRWKPRLVEAGGIREVPKAQKLTTPIEESKLYEMPEDIRAFNEYWKLAELMLRRELQYEEVLVACNH